MPITPVAPTVSGLAPQKWRSSEKIWLPVWRDTSNNLIANSAGFLPVKPMWEQYAIAVYHFIKFKPYSDAAYAGEIDAINSSPWGGFATHQAWISEIHTDGEETIGTETGERVHYVVRCIRRTDGWRFQMPDVGYVYKDGTSRKSFLTDEGFPMIGNLTNTGDDGEFDMIIKLYHTKPLLNFNSVPGLS